MLQFDSETTALLDLAYQGADVTRRRRASFDAVKPQAGDVILDIGCGSGLLTAELARGVGPTGKVVGVDPSPDMLSAARKRCAEFGWVDLVEGVVDPMPVPDASADKAVSLQVFEYLDDLPGACAELFRVLRPGGRVAIGDWHWDTFAWHSDDPDRMARMMAAWDRHLVNRCIPADLPPVMRAAGLVVEDVVHVPYTDHTMRADGVARMMVILMERYAVQNDLAPADEAAAWAQEQHDLAAEGRFFFALTHFVVVARKP